MPTLPWSRRPNADLPRPHEQREGDVARQPGRRLASPGSMDQCSPVMDTTISLDGWDIHRFDDTDWGPWSGTAGDTKAKMTLGPATGTTSRSSTCTATSATAVHHDVATSRSAHDVLLRLIDRHGPESGVSEMTTGDGGDAAGGVRHTRTSPPTRVPHAYIVIFKL